MEDRKDFWIRRQTQIIFARNVTKSRKKETEFSTNFIVFYCLAMQKISDHIFYLFQKFFSKNLKKFEKTIPRFCL